MFYQELQSFAEKSIQRCTNITLLDSVVMAQQQDGTYDVYLPYKFNSDRLELDRGLSLAFRNVIDFKYHHKGHYKSEDALLLLKIRTSPSEGYWTAICPDSFTWWLTSERCELRVKSLPKIYYNGDSEATILSEFDYLWGDSSYITKIDKKTFLVVHHSGSIYRTDSGMTFTEFDSVEPLPFYDAFKVIDNNGETFYDCFGNTIFGPTHLIEKMSVEDYPFLTNEYSGYWAKDQNNYISGLYIGSRFSEGNDHFSYKIVFNEPIKKITFLKRKIVSKSEKNSPFPDRAMDIWLINCENGKQKLIFKNIGAQPNFSFELSYSDLKAYPMENV